MLQLVFVAAVGQVPEQNVLCMTLGVWLETLHLQVLYLRLACLLAEQQSSGPAACDT
jgi:hypothetical protein